MDTYLFETPSREIGALIDGLGESDESERKIAEFALFAQGEKAIKPLIHALYVDDPALRLEAAHVLAELRMAVAAPALMDALNDADEKVRMTAINGLIALKEYALHPILQRIASGLMTSKLQAGLYEVLLGLDGFGVLRGDLKSIVEALKLNLPAAATQGVAEELLKQV